MMFDVPTDPNTVCCRVRISDQLQAGRASTWLSVSVTDGLRPVEMSKRARAELAVAVGRRPSEGWQHIEVLGDELQAAAATSIFTAASSDLMFPHHENEAPSPPAPTTVNTSTTPDALRHGDG